MLKNILKIALYFLIVLLALSLIPYFTTPVYDFPDRVPFTGNKLYNPYSGIQNGKWLKANYHAHSFAWAGFTNGRDNINNEMKERYSSLNYDIISISDYMKINTFMSNDKNYLPVYEHGFGFTKNHQLVIGAETVNWTDYPYYQNIDHKQKTLKEIKKADNIIVLVHPHLRNAYCKEDFKYLTGYDCIEVANQNFGCADDYWDAALSSGYPVFCMADDDSHHSVNYCDIGRCYTMINVDSGSSPAQIIQSLKNGRTIAVDLNTDNKQSFEILKSCSSNTPALENFITNDSSFTLKLSKNVSGIIFTGQGGIMKATVLNANTASYQFLPSDTYIRTTVICSDGSKLYLNPVLRYSGSQLPVYSASVNDSATLIFRFIYTTFAVILAAGFFYFKRRKYKKEIPVVSPAEY
ncbi:MAG: hypothetical protein EHM58_13085 [Ignavibacteriae bacterium]|nr:MAG: hypothetical protein EHM58_13085 [Ignavibacteriota bacterium]